MPEALATVRDLRRDQIIEAARSLVAEAGLDRLTIGGLEKRLPFTRGVITYHFDNKDEIVDAVLQSAIDDIDASTVAGVVEADTLEGQVRAVLKGMVGGYLEHEDAGRILLAFWSRLHHDERAARVTRALYGRYRKQAAGLVRGAQQQGRCRADIDADAIGAVMVALVIGLVTQVYFEPGFADADGLIEQATQSLVAHLTR